MEARAAGDPSTLLVPVRFDDLPGWAEDDHAAAYAAFLASAERVVHAPPKTRALGIDGSRLATPARAALALGTAPPRQAARRFFEAHFVALSIDAPGHVTGYYEPEAPASRTRSPRFPVPLYRRPPDLIDIDDGNRPAGLDPETRFARRLPDGGIVPYHDRAEIEDGALAGRGLELAWLTDPVTAFFIHVQGSARLVFEDGSVGRVTFAAKSGHPYTSIGKRAIAKGILAPDAADKERLEAWLRAHPDEARRLMQENRSFIFFRETPEAEPEAGPIAAAGVALASGRSLAVDRTLHTFHVPVHVAADGLADPASGRPPYRRLMNAQDTGSAIVGPARGDLFIGSGEAAGRIAGRINHAARMWVLAPLGA